MLIPVSNEELDNVPVVMRRFRKGERCVGRVRCTGNVPSRTEVWSRAGQWCGAGQGSVPDPALSACCSLCLPSPSHSTAWTPSWPALVTLSEDIQPGHSALSAQPTPTNQAQAKNHSSKANITQLQPDFISSASSYSLTCSEHCCSCQGLLWPGYSCSQAWVKFILGLCFAWPCSDKPQAPLAPAKPPPLWMSILPARQWQTKHFSLSSTHTSNTPQKTGRNYRVSYLNREFYHLFSLLLLPSCGKFAQISEGRMQTSH